MFTPLTSLTAATAPTVRQAPPPDVRSGTWPRRAAVAAAGAALLAALAPTSPAFATTPSLRPPTPSVAPSDECDAPRVLDGFAITRLPAGLGPMVSDFDYEWEEVVHRSRVWERGPDDEGAYHVDLTVKVLRGERLRDLAALRDYLTEYHERDPDDWPLEKFQQRGSRPGYHDAVGAFWLEAPGVAVEVRVGERFTERDLMRTVQGIRPACA